MSVYVFDIDGTLVTDTNGKYSSAEPISPAIKKLNALYEQGHTIILMTARGMTSHIDYTEFTIKQMNDFGIRFHQLITNAKPKADYYIDDKAINVKDWLEDETNSY